MIISFEGIDGSGKSTQIKRLLTRLDLLGKETLYVREPGGTAMSERVRDILLDPSLDIHPFAEMLLFSAARAQLVKEKISPFHARGGIVVCDRFFDSTIAYQGGGRGVAEPSWLESFQLEVTGGVIPDRTDFVDITTETAESRLNIRFGDEKAADRMEQAGGAFFERVRNAYLTLAERHSERVCIIDGSGTENEVENAIWEDLSLYL